MNLIKNKIFFLYLVVSILVFSVFLTLILYKELDYPWLVGYFLGIACFWSGFFYNQFISKKLIKSLDPFLYAMLFISKLGIYIVPFLISFYLQDFISPIGIIIGFNGLIFMPFIQNMISK
ncbi:hypothetical protein SCORR_v1c00430 [Spiroplasma corruscae]|uniref:ATP synthase protein I n=1 Tax=Spiroplasma corruscae TaxID=216934 RepID=A0A222EMV7_9MOLU|nr:MG406 family protein [Spiroplasma corruscae]ASP27818.1 hypothetical protein SCORR_v1c00430 [Spiroplasma corruscae]